MIIKKKFLKQQEKKQDDVIIESGETSGINTDASDNASNISEEERLIEQSFRDCWRW